MKPTLAKVTAWGWLTLIAVIPFSLSYAYREPVAVSYLGVFSAIVIILAALSLLTGQLKLEKLQPPSLALVLGLLTLLLVWGSLWSEPLRSIFGPWTNRFLLPLAVGYTGYLLFGQGVISKRSVMMALSAGLALLAAFGILQAVGVTESNIASRVTGPYAFPNSYARIVEILLLALFPYLLLAVRGRGQLVGWLIWAAGLIALVMTYSYAGVGSFLFGLAILITLLPSRFTWLKVATLVGLVTIVIAGATLKEALPKYQATISSSLATRQQFWHVAWETIKLHPVTGIGLEGWESQYLGLARHYLVNEQGEAIIETVSAQPHNIYLDGLLRAGIIGLIAVIGFLLWPLIWAVQKARAADANWLTYSGAGISVTLLVFGLVDDPIFADDAMTILMVIYFAIAASNKKAQPQDLR